MEHRTENKLQGLKHSTSPFQQARAQESMAGQQGKGQQDVKRRSLLEID